MARFFEARRLPLLKFGRTGQVLDTIAVVDLPTELLITGLADVAHPLRIAVGAAMLPGLAVTPDGSAVIQVSTRPGQQTSFDLIKLSITGDTLWRRPVSYDPKPVTRAQSSQLRAAFGQRMSWQDPRSPLPMSPIVLEQRRRQAEEAISFPDFHPPVRQVVAGHDGSVWLLREMQPDSADRWEQYSSDGTLEGFVEIRQGKSSDVIPWAPRLHVLRASRNELWGTTVDDLGVTYLHRYQVRRTC
jgi:hypothetical protein